MCYPSTLSLINDISYVTGKKVISVNYYRTMQTSLDDLWFNIFRAPKMLSSWFEIAKRERVHLVVLLLCF